VAPVAPVGIFRPSPTTARLEARTDAYA